MQVVEKKEMQDRLQSWGEHFRWVEEKFVSKNCQLLIVRVKGSFSWNRIRFKTLSSFIAHTLSVLTPPKSQRLLGGMRVVWTLREWRSSTKCTFKFRITTKWLFANILPHSFDHTKKICKILQSKIMCYTSLFMRADIAAGWRQKLAELGEFTYRIWHFVYQFIDRCCTRSAN